MVSAPDSSRRFTKSNNTQVLELDEDVLLYGSGQSRFALEVAVAFFDQLGDARRIGEPTRHERQVFEPLGIEHGVDRAAVGVPANDDLIDLEQSRPRTRSPPRLRPAHPARPRAPCCRHCSR